MGDDVALGDIGDRCGLVGQELSGHQLRRLPLGKAGGAERRRAAPRLRELEDGGLGVVAHEGCTGGLPAGSDLTACHLTTFSKALTKASISALVRRSVTATNNPP